MHKKNSVVCVLLKLRRGLLFQIHKMHTVTEWVQRLTWNEPASVNLFCPERTNAAESATGEQGNPLLYRLSHRLLCDVLHIL